MANPPFAGDIKETRILAKYDLARTVSLGKINKIDSNDKNIIDATDRDPTYPEALHASPEIIYKLSDGTFRKVQVKNQTKTGRDILFIERNLQFLKPGGRMAVVLPQGRFNNSSDKALREYIFEFGRILAVVGLHGNVFKPHTGTKTSVLFIQKWNDDPTVGKLCPRVEDYPIFFATMQEPSKDNSGDKIYRSVKESLSVQEISDIQRCKSKLLFLQETSMKKKVPLDLKAAMSPDEFEKAHMDLDAPLLDSHDHLVVKHDLFNHDGLTQDGIAEAFIEFSKKENLGFFQ